jgi:hypothetical protein
LHYLYAESDVKPKPAYRHDYDFIEDDTVGVEGEKKMNAVRKNSYWVPLDFEIPLPYHIKHGRVPGLFDPPGGYYSKYSCCVIYLPKKSWIFFKVYTILKIRVEVAPTTAVEAEVAEEVVVAEVVVRKVDQSKGKIRRVKKQSRFLRLLLLCHQLRHLIILQATLLLLVLITSQQLTTKRVILKREVVTTTEASQKIIDDDWRLVISDREVSLFKTINGKRLILIL